MENKAISINVQYDGMISKIVETNRKKLVPIAEAVILCGRQNVPLRGHRDDSQHYNEEQPRKFSSNFAVPRKVRKQHDIRRAYVRCS